MYINLILFRLNCQDFRRYFIDGKLGLNLYLKVSSIYFILIIKMHLTCEHDGTMYSQERLLFLRSLKETPNERLYHLLSWDKKHNSPLHTVVQVGFIKSHRRKPRVLCFLYFHIEWTINPCDDTLEATIWFIALDIRIYTDIMSFKLQFCYSKCLSQCQMRKLMSYESKTRKKYVIIGVFGVVITITEWQLGKL